MKTFFKISVFTLVLLLGMIIVSGEAFAGAQDFLLINKSGMDIYELYISPSGENDWEEDVLGGDILVNEDDVEIDFSIGESEALWDIMVRDKQGNEIYWRESNLFEISEITLEKDGSAYCK